MTLTEAILDKGKLEHSLTVVEALSRQRGVYQQLFVELRAQLAEAHSLLALYEANVKTDEDGTPTLRIVLERGLMWGANILQACHAGWICGYAEARGYEWGMLPGAIQLTSRDKRHTFKLVPDADGDELATYQKVIDRNV